MAIACAARRSIGGARALVRHPWPSPMLVWTCRASGLSHSRSAQRPGTSAYTRMSISTSTSADTPTLSIGRIDELQAAKLVDAVAASLATAQANGTARLEAKLAATIAELLTEPSAPASLPTPASSNLALDISFARHIPPGTSNFDLALALLKGAHVALDQLPDTCEPYVTLLVVAAQHGLARPAMQILALLQDNDSGCCITPRMFAYLLQALFGEALLLPQRLQILSEPPQRNPSAAKPPAAASEARVFFSLLKPLFELELDQWLPASTSNLFDPPESSPADVAPAMLDACFLCGDPDWAASLFEKIDADSPFAVQVMLAGIHNTQGAQSMVEWYRRLRLTKPNQSIYGLPTMVGWLSDQCSVNTFDPAPATLDEIIDDAYAYIRTECSANQAHIGARMWLRLTEPGVLSTLRPKQIGMLLASVPPMLSYLPSSSDLSVSLSERLISLADRCVRTSQLPDGAALITWAYRWVDRTVDPPPLDTAVPSKLLDRVALLPEEADERQPNVALSVRQRLLTVLADLIVRTAQDFAREPGSQVNVDTRPEQDGRSLVTLLQSFGPLLVEAPNLLEGLRREMWDGCITSLFRSATRECVGTEPLAQMTPHDWSHVLESLAWEEDELEPDWDRVVSFGLGWGMDQAGQWLARRRQNDQPSVTKREVSRFLQPISFAAVDALLSRYEDRALPLMARISPRLAHLLEVRPWALTEPLPSAPTLDTTDDVAMNPSDQVVDAQHAALVAQADAEPASYPPVQEIDEDMTYALAHRLAATTPVPDTVLDGIERAIMAGVLVGTYPSPDLVTLLITVAGIQISPTLVRRMYAVGLHVLRALPAGQAARGWTDLENAMICASASALSIAHAQTHRADLIAAGQVPTADAYATLIAASRFDRAQATDLYGEFLRLGGPGSAYLFDQVLRHVDVTPERVLDAMLATGVPPHEHWAGLATAVLDLGADQKHGTFEPQEDVRNDMQDAIQRIMRMATRAQIPSATLTPAFNVILARIVHTRDRETATRIVSVMQTHGVPLDSGTRNLLAQM